jgi:hypothetical protein
MELIEHHTGFEGSVRCSKPLSFQCSGITKLIGNRLFNGKLRFFLIGGFTSMTIRTPRPQLSRARDVTYHFTVVKEPLVILHHLSPLLDTNHYYRISALLAFS